MLKCFLLQRKGSFPFTHSIKGLIRICADIDGDFERLFEIRADKLDRYYTGTRYPPLLEVTEEDAKEAIEMARRSGSLF